MRNRKDNRSTNYRMDSRILRRVSFGFNARLFGNMALLHTANRNFGHNLLINRTIIPPARCVCSMYIKLLNSIDIFLICRTFKY